MIRNLQHLHYPHLINHGELVNHVAVGSMLYTQHEFKDLNKSQVKRSQSCSRINYAENIDDTKKCQTL